MQIGIRLHDVNSTGSETEKTMEARCAKAKAEGFSCVHLALGKNISGTDFNALTLTQGVAAYTKRVLAVNGLDLAVLGCYLNLANPDEKQLTDIKKRYYGHIRVAALTGAGVVGTETGAPNIEYRTDRFTHTKEALNTFIHNLADVIACAEDYGVAVAIEPVWNHIVYNAAAAEEVLRSIRSHNLKIILDPVNLLCAENAAEREFIIADALDRLGEYIEVVHLKDFRLENGKIVSIAAGEGEMDYTALLAYLKANKPFIQATLEDTCNETAEKARTYIQAMYERI